MKHIFFAFPGGSAGWALVLFRLSAALWIVGTARLALAQNFWLVALLYVAALALTAGFPTRIIAGLGAAGALVLAVADGDYPAAADSAFILNAVGLMLIGPGAYSIDAAVFGRRTVHLPD